jgi:hypothetical protein
LCGIESKKIKMMVRSDLIVELGRLVHSLNLMIGAGSSPFRRPPLEGVNPQGGSVIFPSMLFIVVEHFKDRNPKPVRDRFVREGRMMPEGVVYHASWVDPASARCFQVMEAKDLDMLAGWTCRWSDLIDFEIVPVLPSQEYWANFGSR